MDGNGLCADPSRTVLSRQLRKTMKTSVKIHKAEVSIAAETNTVCCLLGYDAMSCCGGWVSMLRRQILQPSSGFRPKQYNRAPEWVPEKLPHATIRQQHGPQTGRTSVPISQTAAQSLQMAVESFRDTSGSKYKSRKEVPQNEINLNYK
jgi:hypothetical protein